MYVKDNVCSSILAGNLSCMFPLLAQVKRLSTYTFNQFK